MSIVFDSEDNHDAEKIAQLERKQARIEKERTELLSSVAGGDYSTLKTRVAAMLNHYPHTRNSDVALALKYWETFQPQIYCETGILPNDLFKLERLHYIVRVRAKIQNEYGLFIADEKIRNHRKFREEDMLEAVIQDEAPRRVLSVFADETGKNDKYVIVAAVWALTGHSVFKVSMAIQDWQQSSFWAKREIHFNKLGKNDFKPLEEYLSIIKENSEYLSFKIAAIERARTRRNIEDIIQKLHEHMLVRGVEHEINTGRIDLPRNIEVTFDEEQSLDSFVLSEMHRKIGLDFENSYQGKLSLCSIQTVSSRISPLIQLADMAAGAVNRRLNHVGDRNAKDDMADMIIDSLGLVLNESDFPELDSTALFLV